jgi:tetratricopeptide (TPR) repeat protein
MIQCFDKVLEIDANDAEAWAYKGYAFFQLNFFRAALTSCNRELEIDSKNYLASRTKNGTIAILNKRS